MKNKALKIALISLLAVILLAVVSVFCVIFFVTHSQDYVEFDVGKFNDINNTLSVLDSDGNAIDMTVYLNNSKQVSLSCLSQHTIDAFLSIEDKRFYDHHGLDYKRICGALLNNIKAGDFKEGASTISQQLIKNTHLNNSKTIKRKVNEMLLTFELENTYDKDKILEMYLNTIYFGENAYGIENASNLYFNKSASQLSLAESALLAGIIKAPNSYSPLKNPEKSLERRNLVLQTMLKNEYITQSDYEAAINSDLQFKGENNSAVLLKTYSFGVIKEACELLEMTPLQLINSNLTIETYFDQKCQADLEEAVRSDKTLNLNKKNAHLVAAVSENATNGIKAFVCRGNTDLDEKRQIGSTIKPFLVYAPSIEKKQITTASLIFDEQTTFFDYRPKNYNDKYFGWITVKEALANSLNVVAVKVLNNFGVDNSLEYLKKMGFDVSSEQNLSMALGNLNGGANCRELLQGYSTLASGGLSNRASFIKSIKNSNGEIYGRHLQNKQVFSPQTSFLITDMLQNAAENGTAKNIGKHDFQVAAKTGTVGTENGNTDALLCGYTTTDTFAFWISDNDNLPNSVTGGNAPSKIAQKFLGRYYSKNRPNDFVAPKNIIKLEIDKTELKNNQQVKLANQMTIQSEKEFFYFTADNCPKEYSERNIVKKLQLEVVAEQHKVSITLPQSDGKVLLFKVDENGKTQQLSTDGKVFIDREINQGETYTYYVEMYTEDLLTRRSKSYTVKIPKDDTKSGTETENPQQPEKPSQHEKNDLTPLDFWYLPMR